MKMNDIKTAPFMTKAIMLISNMYRLGWDERNGGNLSYILYDQDINEFLDTTQVIRKIPINFNARELRNKIFLVTGTGKYFKNVEYNPEENLGVIQISEDGEYANLLWGFLDGGTFTSELPSHLMSHIERLKEDNHHRVVIHTHPTNLIAMTLIHELDEKSFTKTLWKLATECIVVFPEGVGVLPWMLCGNTDIGRATADKIKGFRACIWAAHGIFGTGTSLDETFGLIETIEKAAEIYMLCQGQQIINSITDDQLKAIALAFKVKVKAGWLL